MKFIYAFVLAVVLSVVGAEVGQARFALESAPQNGTMQHCMALSFSKGSIVVYTCLCYGLDGWNPREYGPFYGFCITGAGLTNYGCNWVPAGGFCGY